MAEDSAEQIQVEVAYAEPGAQYLELIKLPVGATVAEALTAAANIPEDLRAELKVGIWGSPVTHEHVVNEGDRVELYRPLLMDPGEARRQRAAASE